MYFTCSTRTREEEVLVVHLERIIPEKVGERKGLAKKSRKNESGGQHAECVEKNGIGMSLSGEKERKES